MRGITDSLDSVNFVVPPDQVLPVAVQWATLITENSPDAVASTKRGILLGKQFSGIETSTIAHAWSIESKRVFEGDNIKVIIGFSKSFDY
jgi:enoyl-CoA hydratase/carnithine racemase